MMARAENVNVKERVSMGSLSRFLLRHLQAPASNYEQRIINNMESLYRHIRPGDVILVEGQSRLSRVIRLLTQSFWSHAALYVGSDSHTPSHEYGDGAYEQADQKHLLIEAQTGSVVRAVPLKIYQHHNIRICRPFGISSGDLEIVIAEVINNLGKQYDHQNILDLALMLLPSFLNPFKKRTIKACLVGCTEYKVICSGMIAKAFQGVGYPIVPALHDTASAGQEPGNPYGSKLIMRHYSQITPGDFDLSPNFEIIKYNIIEVGRFEYKSIWADKPA
jgi:cell wall-associated NlpC family hydrolase